MTESNLTRKSIIHYIDGEISPIFREYGAKRGKIGIFAIHAGSIERGTEQIVRNIVERTTCSVYIFSGRKKTGNSTLHISSIKFASQSRPLFSNIFSHVDRIVAIHGHNQNKRYVYIGGRNIELKDKITEDLRKVLPEYNVVKALHKIPNQVKGNHPNNFVNLPPEGGVQIELPRQLRKVKTTTGWYRHEWSDLYGASIRVADTLVKIINSSTEA